jgi:HPt (histidine-containing phosphotransfer) domain-containing protein
MDRQGFLHRLMGDEDLARILVETFCRDVPIQAVRLKSAVAGREPGLAASVAHRVGGSSGLIGGQALHEIAAAMEQAGKAQDQAALDRLMPEFEIELERLLEALAHFH